MKTNKLLKSIMFGALCAITLLAYAEQVKVVRVYNRDKVIATHKISDFQYFQVEDAEAAELIQDVETFTVNGVSFDMIKVVGGTYKMGDDDSDQSKVKPAHDETVGTFQIGKTEVTQELWETVMGSNPSTYKLKDRPVERVSWTDCNEFIDKLNDLTGKNFRLPTEAEWEYAARGGNKSQGYTYSGSNAIDDVAWYRENSSSRTQSVATKQPNELGIYDMTGNVWEWTSDKYSDDYNSDRTSERRVFRGGGFYSLPNISFVAFRDNGLESYSSDSMGLRLAL